MLFPFPVDREVRERLDRLDLPFGPFGVDPYGASKVHLGQFFTVLKAFYRHYFSVDVHGLEHVPRRGRVMLVGNHSGGYAIDGGMVIASMFFEPNPPRLAQGMAEKFINRIPLASLWANRLGQLTGLPEHAERLLEDDRMLLVFPEGERGTAKLYRERYSLVNFGSGFMRLAMKTKTPVVPFAFLGGGEAVPTVVNSYALGKVFGVPYVPITPYGVPLPLPAKLEVHYDEPLVFEGTGNEEDDVVAVNVEKVKARIARLVDEGYRHRRGVL